MEQSETWLQVKSCVTAEKIRKIYFLADVLQTLLSVNQMSLQSGLARKTNMTKFKLCKVSYINGAKLETIFIS